MAHEDVTLRGIDTLLFRDGRPFDVAAGGRAETLQMPFPSTVAGFIRTQCGPSEAGDWRGISQAVVIRGPLLLLNGQPVYHAPADAVVLRSSAGHDLMALGPQAVPASAGCDVPGGMMPAMPLNKLSDGKADSDYKFWAACDMYRWLLDEPVQGSELKKISGPAVDTRTHVAVTPEGVAEKSKLFTTTMTTFESYSWPRTANALRTVSERWSLLCRIYREDGTLSLRRFGAFGGESRAAIIGPAPNAWPSCPPQLAAKLAVATHVRMILATPAIFQHGWIPAWLDRTTKTGTPPGLQGVELKLVSAAIPRRQAVSGWDLSGQASGQKPVRYCAPAGSVYFFEAKQRDNLSKLAMEGWLAPLSDVEHTPQGRMDNNLNDGFGLALWGVWRSKEDAN